MPGQISVIVRAMNKVETIGATLEALRGQTVPVEIIVVDSGSTDGTLDVARTWADQVIELPKGTFSYGGALNVGAAAASSAVHGAMSAHCVPRTDDWAARSLECYERSDCAGTNGADWTPGGRPIDGVHWQSLADVALNPGWGFSNHASTWSAEAWRRFPFREDLLACEDKEWSWRALAAGWTIAYGPHLAVPTGHRRAAGPAALVDRLGREAEAMVSLGAADPQTASTILRSWWSDFPVRNGRPLMVRRASHRRNAELLGVWKGSRRARPLPDAELPGLLAAAGLHRRRWPYLPWA